MNTVVSVALLTTARYDQLLSSRSFPRLRWALSVSNQSNLKINVWQDMWFPLLRARG